MYKSKKEDKHPLSINVLKLQRYNFSFFDTEEVVLFEYLVVKGMSFKTRLDFFHSTTTITKETGIKKHSINTIISKFKRLGIIDTVVKGMPRVKHFIIIYPKIIELLPNIYQSSENGKLSTDFRKVLIDFFQPLAENYLKKNNIQNNKEEYKKENKDYDTDRDNTFSVFIDFISNLKYEIGLDEKKLKVDTNLLQIAIDYYGEEIVLFYMKKYFDEKGNYGSVADFLKFDNFDNRKLKFIEIELAKEKKYTTEFLKNLEESFSRRREMITKDKSQKKGLSTTKLVINESIKKLASECLRQKSELEINNAFTAYADAVLKDQISVKKFLPYFFSKQFGEYSVIETYLDFFNLNYSYSK
jgi:hypothetical protein